MPLHLEHSGSLAGRVAFITGGASGIGLGMAQAFAAAGMRLALADIDAERAQRELAALGVPGLSLGLDVRDRDAWARAVQRCETELGPIHLLCNNAGVTTYDPLIEMPPENWDWLVAVNLTGIWNGVRACGPGMSERRAGHIVNTASTAGLHVPQGATVGAYSATKAAVVALSEALRQELAASGVGVSVLCPGLVSTRIGETAAAQRPVAAVHPRPVTLARSAPTVGVDPRKVGDRVLTGILRNEPYIITHPYLRERLEERMQALLDCYREAADPDSPVPDNWRQFS